MLVKSYEKQKADIINTLNKFDDDKKTKVYNYIESAREGPSSSVPTKIRQLPPTDFRKFYDRGDLPVAIEHSSAGNKIIWKAELDSLDYHHYLPIFVEGLRETQHPYAFLAREGVHNLLEQGKNRVLPVIP